MDNSIIDNKHDIFERYNYLSKNQSKNTDYERLILLDIIINNNWSNEYFIYRNILEMNK